MNTLTLIHKLGMKFNSTYEINVAVSKHRAGHPEWNWVDAATDLLAKLEGAK